MHTNVVVVSRVGEFWKVVLPEERENELPGGGGLGLGGNYTETIKKVAGKYNSDSGLIVI